MPHRKHHRRMLRIVLFSLAAWAFTVLQPRAACPGGSCVRRGAPPRFAARQRAGLGVQPGSRTQGAAHATRRRLAANLAFVALFFTGASFSAFAGDNVADLLQDDGSETLAVVEATEVPEGQHVEEFEPEPAPPVEAAPAPEPAPAPEAAPAPGGSRRRGGAGRGTGDGGRARRGRGSRSRGGRR